MRRIIKIKEINDYNKKKKNKKEFNIKNYEDENNRYKSIDKENEKNVKEEFNKKNPFYFDYNIKNKKEDRKNKKDFKQTYFSYDNFYFYNIPSENRKKSKYMNYTQDLKKIFKKYNDQRLLRKNNNFNSFNKILFKVDKFKQSQEENKFKSNNLFKNSIDLGDTTKYRNISNIINYKSLSLEKPSKLERIIENIYSDINKTSDNPSKNNFERKLLDMKSKIKNSNIICIRNNIETMNASAWRRVWEIWNEKYPAECIESPCLIDYFVYNVIGKQFCKEILYQFECETHAHTFMWHSGRNKTCQVCLKNGIKKVKAQPIARMMPCSNEEGYVAIQETPYVLSLPDEQKISECPFKEICQENRYLQPPKSISILGQTGWTTAYARKNEGGGGLMA